MTEQLSPISAKIGYLKVDEERATATQFGKEFVKKEKGALACRQSAFGDNLSKLCWVFLEGLTAGGHVCFHSNQKNMVSISC